MARALAPGARVQRAQIVRTAWVSESLRSGCVSYLKQPTLFLSPPQFPHLSNGCNNYLSLFIIPQVFTVNDVPYGWAMAGPLTQPSPT